MSGVTSAHWLHTTNVFATTCRLYISTQVSCVVTDGSLLLFLHLMKCRAATYSHFYVRLSEFIVLIGWLAVWSIKCQEMVKKKRWISVFPKTSTKVLFVHNPKIFSLLSQRRKENQEIITLEKLESMELALFPFLKNDSNWWIDYENRWWLIYCYSWKLID